MKKENSKYKILVHCKLHQIKEGFEANIQALPFTTTTKYTDLSEDGILSKLKFLPNLIVILLNEVDSDFTLPLKIKLFAKNTPLLIILPSIPDSYLNFLKKIEVNEIIQLPADREQICKTILNILQSKHLNL